MRRASGLCTTLGMAWRTPSQGPDTEALSLFIPEHLHFQWPCLLWIPEHLTAPAAHLPLSLAGEQGHF